MALFNKKKKDDVSAISEIPELPELPPLPKLPDFTSDNMQFTPNALPRFPPSSLGDKFSQTTIKDAISGEKEGEEEMANESEEVETMPKLPEGPLTREILPEEFISTERKRTTYSHLVHGGPMYVRLDKFEENLEIFDRIKKQLASVERIFDEIKRTKEQEDKELGEWQTRLQTMKEQIEKIDKDIFSKLE